MGLKDLQVEAVYLMNDVSSSWLAWLVVIVIQIAAVFTVIKGMKRESKFIHYNKRTNKEFFTNLFPNKNGGGDG